MKVLAAFLVLAVLTALSEGESEKVKKHQDSLPGEYVIVYKDTGKADKKAKDGKLKEKNPKPIKTLNMVAVEHLSPDEVYAIAIDPDVDYVEEVIPVHAFCTPTSYDASNVWGIDRSDQLTTPLDGSYTPNTENPSGEEVVAYVLDTGIFAEHPDFTGRAIEGESTVRDSDSDGNGHGTHCAGTIGGYRYGINKDVSLVGIKVLNSRGSGTTTSIIEGIDAAISRHNNRGGSGVAKSVMNLSLGGGASSSLDQAVRSAVNAGIVTVVAAGNNNADASNTSPAREPLAITVAASDSSDKKASFSNYGSVIDIVAPGESITSAWKQGRKRRQAYYGRIARDCSGNGNSKKCETTSPETGPSGTTDVPTGPTNTISGTSMAAPHVAGVATLILQNAPAGVVYTPQQVLDIMLAGSSKNAIKGFDTATTNDLVQSPIC